MNLQLFKINDFNDNSLPLLAVNIIKPVRLENIQNYILSNQLCIEDVLFIGFMSKSLKNGGFAMYVDLGQLYTSPSAEGTFFHRGVAFAKSL